MITSVTDIMSYLRCRRQWSYGSRWQGNWAPVGMSSMALELGGIMHRALAEWMLDAEKNLQLIFVEHAVAREEEIKEVFKKSKGFSMSDADLLPFHEIVGLGAKMAKNYQDFYGVPLPPEFTFASAEQEILVPIPGTEHPCLEYIFGELCTECNGTGITHHYLSATLDGLLQHERGHLFVLERKTIHPRYVPSRDSLEMNFQFTGYTWVLRELTREAEMGPVAGVFYDGLIKSEKPARGKTLADLFIRTNLLKTDAELDEWGVWLTKIVLEMAGDPPLIPNVPWQGCGDCAYTDLCRAQQRGEPIELLLRRGYSKREIVRVQGVRE